MFAGVVIVRVLDDSVAHFEGKVQPAKSCVAGLEVFDNAKRVQIVIEEKPMLTHRGIERLFSRMPEWRMPDVMHQGQGFDEINVQSQLRSDGARDLRDFQSMSQPVAEMIGVAAGKNLRLGFQPAKRPRMNHSVAVALKVVAVGMWRLRMTPPAGVLHADSVGSHRVIWRSGHRGI